MLPNIFIKLIIRSTFNKNHEKIIFFYCLIVLILHIHNQNERWSNLCKIFNLSFSENQPQSILHHQLMENLHSSVLILFKILNWYNEDHIKSKFQGKFNFTIWYYICLIITVLFTYIFHTCYRDYWLSGKIAIKNRSF